MGFGAGCSRRVKMFSSGSSQMEEKENILWCQKRFFRRTLKLLPAVFLYVPPCLYERRHNLVNLDTAPLSRPLQS